MTVWLVTEIPGPYRNPHFAELTRQFQNKGHSFSVHFMSEEDDIRPSSWFDKKGINYPHVFYPKKTLRLGRRKIYWNLQLILAALKEKPDLVILGGLWSSLTCLCILLLLPKHRTIGWVELNERVLGVSNPITNWVRKRLLLRPSALAVPGQSAKNYLQGLLTESQCANLSYIYFPNLIDEGLFQPNVDAAKSPIIEPHRTQFNKIAFWPARLEEEKGVLPFIELLTAEMLRDWKIFLFGEGSLRDQAQELIEKKKLGNVIHIHSYVSPSEVVSIYRSVDILLLPSLRDPNPLSTIEALRMGIPLLTSSAVGNHFEAVTAKNGWVFRLEDSHQDKISLLTAVFSTSKERLSSMGEESGRIYEEKWKMKGACSRTVQETCSLNSQLT